MSFKAKLAAALNALANAANDDQKKAAKKGKPAGATENVKAATTRHKTALLL